MKVIKKLSGLFLAFFVVHIFAVAALAEDGDKAWPRHLRLLTGPNGGQWFHMGEPIAQALSRDVCTTTSRIGGGVDNISSVNARRGDIGFTLQSFLSAGRHEEYQNLKADNAVMMVNIYPQVLYFLVRKDFADKHNITDVESLLRKKMYLRFASLRPGTASEFILTLLLRHGYNTSFDQLRSQGWTIQFNNYAETADNFVDGRIDCFAYTAGTNVPLIKTMEEHMDVRILPVNVEALNVMRDKFHTNTYTIDPGDYKCVSEPLNTLGDYTGLIVRKDLPEDMVFAINKSLWENREAITSVVKDFGGLAPDTALPEGGDVHPGARKFWTSVKAGKN